MAIQDTFRKTFSNLPSQTGNTGVLNTDRNKQSNADFLKELRSGPVSSQSNTSTNSGATFTPAPVVSPMVPKVESKPIAVDPMAKARADLAKAQSMLNNIGTPSTGASQIAKNIANQPDQETPDVTESVKETKTFREQAEEALLNNFNGTNQQSQADARAIKSEEVRLSEKAAESNAVLNEIRNARLDFEDQIEEIEKNKSGSFGPTALNSQKNRVITEYNRNAARQAVRYDILQGRTTEAQNTVDTYIKDLQTDRNNQIQSFQLMMDFMNNDMSESEKLQAQQQHEINMLGYEAEAERIQSETDSLINQENAAANALLIESGQMTIKDIPEDQRVSTVEYMQKNGIIDAETKAALDTVKSTSTLAQEIKNMDLGWAVGGGLQNVLGTVGEFFTSKSEVKSKIESLLAGLSLSNVDKLSGPKSDKDIEILQNASTSLDRATSEETFLKEIDKILIASSNLIIDNPLSSTPDKESALITRYSVKFPEATDEEIAEMVEQTLPDESSVSSVSIPQSSRLSYVNNNPGNLRFAGQSNSTQGEGGFARFNSPEEGYQALENQIQLDQSRDLSLSEFVNKFAPPSENDTQSYIDFLVKNLNVSPDTSIATLPVSDIARVVALKESSTNIV